MSPLHGPAAGAGTSTTSGTGSTGPAGGPAPPAGDDLGLDVQFARLTEAGRVWIAIKRDQAVVSVQRTLLLGAIGLGGVIVLSAVISVSVFLLLAGLAAMLETSLQLGDGGGGLIVGGVLLALIGLGAWLTTRSLRRGWSRKLRERYAPPGAGSPA